MRRVSEAAWAAVAAIAVALFGAGGFFQSRRAPKAPPQNVGSEDAKQLLAMIPLIAGLQEREQQRDDEMQEIRVLLAAHGQWDLQVLAEVRRSNPDFPDPPPLHRLDPGATDA